MKPTILNEHNYSSYPNSVFVFVSKNRFFVLDTTGVEDIDRAVTNFVVALTSGCNYHYKFISKTKNIYCYE